MSIQRVGKINKINLIGYVKEINRKDDYIICKWNMIMEELEPNANTQMKLVISSKICLRNLSTQGT